jgi:hypothetical protein
MQVQQAAVGAEVTMKKLASILLVMSVAIVANAADSQAGWKQRGWYLKRPGANCVMRKVVVSGMNGKVIVRKVRVCR